MKKLKRSLFALSLLIAFISGHSVAAQTAPVRIVFQAPVTIKTGASKSSTTTYYQIFSMNADGSGVVQLTSTLVSSLGPRWSPGQQYISFIRNNTLWVMDAAGEANGGRSFPVAAANAGGADWSPDGLALVFQGANDGLYFVSVDPGAGAAGTPVLFHAGSWFTPNWSSDGTRIAANGSDDGSANFIAVFDATTGAELAVFSAPSPNVALYPNFHPSWSPDGTQLAFSGPVIVSSTGRNGKVTTTSYNEIFLANPDGTGLRRVTYLNSFSYFPSWSADGTTLAFRSDVSGTQSIYRMLLGGNSVTLLHSPGNNLDWNP